jgi:hypothetical protein
MQPSTADGAREVIVHFASELLRPPLRVPQRARATCTRYLGTARTTVAREGARGCALHLRATKALAMCHWLAGRDAPAHKLVTELAKARCSDVQTGLHDAVWLSERWWRPEWVQGFVSGQRLDHPARARQMARLKEVQRAVEATRAALGRDYPRRGGGLLVSNIPLGMPAGRAGLRRGDVIISVAARPTRRLADIAKHLSGRTTALTSVFYYRNGRRIEGSWPGVRAGEIDVTSLPERLP